MPSQRDANKRCIATWIPKGMKAALEKQAKELGKPLAAHVADIYRTHLKNSTPPTKRKT